ncbi:hypothetical protein ACFP81_05455 [Deinococcus lacus]|uniref:Low temperature-induced protein n=1 Tax=Deinococcus lacus TaxID=392561 RepID=A0ABW1YE55_9DEIO
MKHIVFPTVQQADAFVADLEAQGLVMPERRERSYRTTTTTTTVADANNMDMNGNGETVGSEAAKGAAAGAITGAAAALTGAALTAAAGAATVATGGLAAPLLGLTLLGTGVGAAVGATGEAVRETSDADYYDVQDTQYQTINETYQSGGRAVAVDDNVPADKLQDAVARHGGRFIS